MPSLPYLGAPFLAEGSAEGLFETIALIRALSPRLLIHAIRPSPKISRWKRCRVLRFALRDVYDKTLQGIGQGKTLVEIIHQNFLRARFAPSRRRSSRSFVMRDQLMTRVYQQRTGYWKPDGEGMEVFAPSEWAAALDLLGGGKEEAFVRSAKALCDRSDDCARRKTHRPGAPHLPRRARP